MILQEWLEAKIKPGLNVLHVGKRIKPFQHWEPIYIGTNQVQCSELKMNIPQEPYSYP